MVMVAIMASPLGFSASMRTLCGHVFPLRDRDGGAPGPCHAARLRAAAAAARAARVRQLRPQLRRERAAPADDEPLETEPCRQKPQLREERGSGRAPVDAGLGMRGVDEKL